VQIRKQNIKISIKNSVAEGLGLKLGEIGTDGQNLFIGTNNKNVSLTAPIGSIVAWHPAGFTSSNNTGFTSLENLIDLPNGFVEADGRLIEDEDSPFNGYYVCDLTSNIFLMGTNESGLSLLGQDFSFGGVNHIGPPAVSGNNGNNTMTISANHLPPHTHPPGTLNVPGKSTSSNGAHSHTSPYPNFVGANVGGGGIPMEHLGAQSFGSGAAGAHAHSFTISSGQFSGSFDNGGFSNDIIAIIPKYLLVKYIIRVK